MLSSKSSSPVKDEKSDHSSSFTLSYPRFCLISCVSSSLAVLGAQFRNLFMGVSWILLNWIKYGVSV